MIISNGYGQLVLWPGWRIHDVINACHEGIDAKFDDDGVCDYMREKILEIRKQNCSNKFLIVAFIDAARETDRIWNGTNTP